MNTPALDQAREAIEAGAQVVVSMSGGKDSTAASLLLTELEIPHRRLYLDTGWEHRSHYPFIDTLEERLGPIARVRQPVPLTPGFEGEIKALEARVGVDESPMIRLCVWKGVFPGQGRGKWCSLMLKVVPAARWLDAQDCDIVNVVGIRRAESGARKNALAWEAMTKVEVNPVVRLEGEGRWFHLDHVEQWRPLVEWSEADVVAIHKRHNVPLNPLYRSGSGRVGCWPCIHACTKTAARQFGEHDPERVAVVRDLEALVQRRWRERLEAKGEEPQKHPPAFWMLRDPVLGSEFRCVPVDQVLEWANTSRGGRQLFLTPPPARDWACSRYGFCEMPEAANPLTTTENP